jgi:hypothetical protein
MRFRQLKEYWHITSIAGLIGRAAFKGNRTTQRNREAPVREAWCVIVAVVDLPTQQHGGAQLHSATAKE